IILDCDGDIPSAATLTAEDNCSTATVEFNETITQGECSTSYAVERVWIATDTGGNQTVHTQLISVEDTIAPTFSSDLPADISVSCDAIPQAPTLTATDNCSDVSVVFNEYEEQVDQCGSQYNIIREWEVTDLC